MLTAIQTTALNNVAAEIGVRPEDLYNLIYFESKFNPIAKNPRSSARGLLQFIDETAQSLGYENSLDLVNKNPTIESQLNGPVRDLLNYYKPYPTLQSLYMAVFYPAAQYWPSDKNFPSLVTASNPGIETPQDYMALVSGHKQSITPPNKIAGAFLISGIVIFLYFLTRKV